jgi:hypothetical protein
MDCEYDGWTLFEVLDDLHDKKKSGRLHVYHWEEKEAIVGVKGGRIIHSRAGKLRGIKAFNVIRNWVTVSFRFFDNVKDLLIDIEEETDTLLRSLEEQNAYVVKLRNVIPSPQIIFALSPESPDEKVSFNKGVWKVLSLVNGRNSVKDICQSSRANEFSVLRLLSALNRRGIVYMASAEPPLDIQDRERFLQEMEATLARYVGPMASLVVEDTLKEMGRGREYICRDDLPLLIERICEIMEDEKDQIQFQGRMLGLIQKIPKQQGHNTVLGKDDE